MAEGESLTINVSTSDIDGDSVALSVSGRPQFATWIDNGDGSGQIHALPSFVDSGTYPVTITATDNGPSTLTSFETFDLIVTNTENHAPTLSPIGSQTVVAGGSLTVNLSASDSDGNGLFFGQTGLPAFGSFTDNGNGTATITLTPGEGDVGDYPMEVFVDDNGVPALGDSEAISISVTAGGTLVFEQDGSGLLVMEGEHFSANTGGGSVGPWLLINEGNASGSEAMKSPGGGVTSPPATATSEYMANFVAAGNHYIWIRFRAFNAGSDSIFVELDELGSQQRNVTPVSGNWAWIRFVSPYQLNPGGHVVKLHRRERDIEVDKVVVTTNAGFTPTGLGPPESAQSGGVATNAPPQLAPIDSQIVAEGDNATILLSATDSNGDQLTFSHSALPPFATFIDNGNGSGSILLAPTVGQAGEYLVDVTVEDNGSPPLNDTQSFTISVTAAGTTVFEQDAGGLLTMEAEHFTLNQGGNGVDPWSVISDATSSNASAIKAAAGLYTGQPNTAWTEYTANFVVAGPHYVWIRFKAINGGSDSLFAEIDGTGIQTLSVRPVTGNWAVGAIPNVIFNQSGAHTLRCIGVKNCSRSTSSSSPRMRDSYRQGLALPRVPHCNWQTGHRRSDPDWQRILMGRAGRSVFGTR